MVHSSKEQAGTLPEPEEGMSTPWGRLQVIKKISRGVYWADAAHGGIMMTQEIAQQFLTTQACKIGEKRGRWIYFEEDCTIAAPLFEHPEWAAWPGFSPQENYDPEEVLRRYFPSYFDIPVQTKLSYGCGEETMRLCDYMNGNEGWGQLEGRRVRAHLEYLISQAPQRTIIALSLEGITRTDSVFPREAVVEIARRERCQRGICLIHLHDPNLLENWDNAAPRCQQPLFVWNTNTDEPHVLGPQISVGLCEMLRFVLSVDRARASKAATTLKISIQNASNKLRDLWEAGYILREEQCAHSGGKEYLYFKIAELNCKQ